MLNTGCCMEVFGHYIVPMKLIQHRMLTIPELKEKNTSTRSALTIRHCGLGQRTGLPPVFRKGCRLAPGKISFRTVSYKLTSHQSMLCKSVTFHTHLIGRGVKLKAMCGHKTRPASCHLFLPSSTLDGLAPNFDESNQEDLKLSLEYLPQKVQNFLYS